MLKAGDYLLVTDVKDSHYLDVGEIASVNLSDDFKPYYTVNFKGTTKIYGNELPKKCRRFRFKQKHK